MKAVAEGRMAACHRLLCLLDVYVCVYGLCGSTASNIPAINNTYGCDTNGLCLLFIIKTQQAEGKSDHVAVCPWDFPHPGVH